MGGVLPWAGWYPQIGGTDFLGVRGATLYVETALHGKLGVWELLGEGGVRVGGGRIMSGLTNLCYLCSPTLKVFLGGACLRLPLPRLLQHPFVGSGVQGGSRTAS